MGYTEDLVHLSATVIQYSYRIYRFIHSAKMKLSEQDAFEAAMSANSMQLIEEIEKVKESRRKVLSQV